MNLPAASCWVSNLELEIIPTFVIPAKAGIQRKNWIPHQVRNDRNTVTL